MTRVVKWIQYICVYGIILKVYYFKRMIASIYVWKIYDILFYELYIYIRGLSIIIYVYCTMAYTIMKIWKRKLDCWWWLGGDHDSDPPYHSHADACNKMRCWTYTVTLIIHIVFLVISHFPWPSILINNVQEINVKVKVNTEIFWNVKCTYTEQKE